VADFGLAHAVEISGRQGGASGQLLATAEYVAPELVAEGRADPRADVYSTGVVLFEMLTGRVPFDGERPADVAWQHVDHDVPAPSRVVPGLPSLLDDVVARATRRDPAGRPRDAAAMLAEIQSAREDVSALAGPTRALAHPTVVVPAIPPAPRDGRGDDARPSWARLPAPKGPVAVARGSVARAGRKVVELGAASPLRGAWTSIARATAGLRGSARGRRQLTAVIVVLGLVLMAGGWWLGFGRYTEAPTLVAATKANAEAEAARLGFHVEYGAGRYTEDVAIDTVLEQSPAPGHRILKGGTVTLYVSLGRERYTVPDVAGQALDFATAQLKKFVVQTRDGHSDTLPTNYVVGTDPAAGTAIKPNATVTLIIAKGPYPVHVPALVGKQRADAETLLRSQGFTPDVQVKEDETTKPKDQVLEQNPPSGQGLDSAKDVKVTIIVAKGPAGPPMPSVLNARCADAVNSLRGQGLQVNANGNELEQFFWTVKQQSPNPGDPLTPGQTVNLTCG
jgi:serine/threonine-protein kinase